MGDSSLIKLNLSDNHISYIHEQAFARQSKLQTVDLSRNALVFIEPNTFRHNRHLETLSLAYNEHLKLSDEGSLLNAKYLKVLYLSACNLSNIPPKTFWHIPKLEILYISHNKLKVLPHLQGVQRLKILDVGHNYLADLNSEVFSASPKLKHLNLSYNKLTTLDTTVMSELANRSIPAHLKGNPWVCDCTFYTIYSTFSSHGVDLEFVCSSPPKCSDKLWTECYKAGCDGNDIVVDQVEEMLTFGFTAVPSAGLENHGHKNASDTEEIKILEYTSTPSESLENHGRQNASDSFGTQIQKQEMDNKTLEYISFALILLTIIVFIVIIVIIIILANICPLSKSRPLRVPDGAEGDPESSCPLQNTES